MSHHRFNESNGLSNLRPGRLAAICPVLVAAISTTSARTAEGAVSSCAKSTTFSCLSQFSYSGESTGTWAESD